MKKYFSNLKKHPDLMISIMLTIFMIMVGATDKSYDNWCEGALLGLVVSLLFPWLIILLTTKK